MSAHALLDASDLPHLLPDFAAIDEADYAPALEQAMVAQRAEVEAVLSDTGPATFASVLVPLEASGARLDRVLRVLGNQAGADTTPVIDDVRRTFAPLLAAHHDAITLDPRLWARLSAVVDAGEQLDDDAAYLLQRWVARLRSAGAALPEADKERLRALNQRLSSLEADFGLALQADTGDLAVLVEDVAQLDGLSDGEISAAAAAAQARGLEGHLITLVLPTAHPLLASLTDRALRRRLFEAQRVRGSRGGEHDTRAIVLEIVRLRAERARLLGHGSHADLVTADNTAGTPRAVRDLLERLAPAAAANARREKELLEAEAGHPVEAWDWPFYAERVRASRHSVDTAALRPWFEAERVLRHGVFAAAEQLYGLTFTERPDLPGYHPEVRVFEVARDGEAFGLYLLDLHTRDSKRGGAWMSSLVVPNRLRGVESAVVVNNLNVPRPGDGEPTLLTLDETRTLFHEFGHALHGLLARATYPSQGGTAVFRDFVEFPSQVNEMWMMWPALLEQYAVHHRTGEPLPTEVIERLQAAATFNEGFATSEYLAAALLDLAWHELGPDDVPTDVEQVAAFEAQALAVAGLDDPAVPPRYSSAYFAHAMGSGYAAAYYSYIWSEVLDADTQAWFEQAGGPTRANGAAYEQAVLAIGGTCDPLESYLRWRGRPAPVEPLLVRRGLD